MALAAALFVFATSFATHSHSKPAHLPQQVAPAAAFKNLKVLAADTSSEQLRATMRGFTTSLGVQCNFCHMPRDFASDANPHKETARGMLRLVQRLNGSELKEIPGLENAKVTCFTCHNGSSHPAISAPAPAPAGPAAPAAPPAS